MSWVQLLRENWRSTDDEAELHLWPEDAGYPRQSWNLNLYHDNTSEALDPIQRWLSVNLGELHFHEPDWRRLSGLQIRADLAWQERHEFTQDYGRPVLAEVDVSYGQVIAPPGKRTFPGGHDHWIAHDFILRLGSRDGHTFPCEIDAWLIPEEHYYRQQPETEEQVRRFALGPPNLRVIARATFSRGTVVMPRCGDDPLPLARRYLREATACEDWHRAKVEWAVRRSHDKKENVRMPGWGSTVKFFTQA